MSFGEQTDPVAPIPARSWRVEYKTTSRAEHYAALTFAIVLLRSQVAGDHVSPILKTTVLSELERLETKRAELEEQFEDRRGGA